MNSKFLKKHNIVPFSLFHLLSIESYSGNCGEMQRYIENYVDFLRDNLREASFEVKIDELGNIFITKSEFYKTNLIITYPCVVAHIDTVHPIRGGGIVPIQIGDKITGIDPKTMKQTGIGGDDKCGIYAALQSLQYLPFCKVAFFVDEEIGCYGSINTDVEFFKDCRFILQADRRGNSDFVNNINGPISSKEFQNDILPIIEKYGYSFSDGMMTDVEALSDNAVGISCANMSAGYYNPHMDYEYISLNDLDRVINLILDICGSLTNTYPFDISKRISYKKKQRETLKRINRDLNVSIWGSDEDQYWSLFEREINKKEISEKEINKRGNNKFDDMDYYPGRNKQIR